MTWRVFQKNGEKWLQVLDYDGQEGWNDLAPVSEIEALGLQAEFADVLAAHPVNVLRYTFGSK